MAPREVTVLFGDPERPDPTKRTGRYAAEDHATIRAAMAALATLPGYRMRFLLRHRGLPAAFLHNPPRFVLNLCDTGYRNQPEHELHVPALLEMLDIPYTGAPPAALALCFDKAAVRAIAAAHGIPVPEEHYLANPSSLPPLRYPALIKPNLADGSFGITRQALIHDEAAARAYLTYLADLMPGRAVLVQEFLSGAEYTVGLIGNPATGLTVLPVIETDFGALPGDLPAILPYEAKAAQQQLTAAACLLFERLGCRDYARIDFRTDADGVIKLLEVNPNPAWAHDGKLAMMARMAGHSYAEMLTLILAAAEARLRAADRVPV